MKLPRIWCCNLLSIIVNELLNIRWSMQRYINFVGRSLCTMCVQPGDYGLPSGRQSVAEITWLSYTCSLYEYTVVHISKKLACIGMPTRVR